MTANSDTSTGDTTNNAEHVKAVAAKGLDTELGLLIESVTDDGLVAVLDIEGKHLQPFGIVHGGVYCAIAESVASMSAYFWLKETGIGGTAVGVNNNTDFLKSVGSGRITARSAAIHRGRRQQLWSVEIFADDGRMVARSQVRLQNVELPDGVTAP